MLRSVSGRRALYPKMNVPVVQAEYYFVWWTTWLIIVHLLNDTFRVNILVGRR